MKPNRRGFALILTLLLVALLVMAVYALSVAGRVGSGAASVTVQQALARRHAMLGLALARARVQEFAGADDACTGMAGITGIPAGSGNPARHWCGVWSASGTFRGWLASGAADAGSVIPGLTGADAIEMLGEGALGADSIDKEHVRVLLQPVLVANDATARRSGSYAWWVGDEGVKLSAVLAEGEGPATGHRQAIDELIPVLSPTDANLTRVQAFAQLALVTSPALTPGQLQSNFHALTVTHRGPQFAGLLNVNATTARFWRGVAATYNRWRAADAPALATTGFANRMRDRSPGVFVTVPSFLANSDLAAALDQNGGVTPAQFSAALMPWLAVRSDTFRIRVYGDARNPADASAVEAVAWCEAIIERTGEPLPGFGRRFVVTYFRWLGPDDL